MPYVVNGNILADQLYWNINEDDPSPFTQWCRSTARTWVMNNDSSFKIPVSLHLASKETVSKPFKLLKRLNHIPLRETHKSVRGYSIDGQPQLYTCLIVGSTTLGLCAHVFAKAKLHAYLSSLESKFQGLSWVRVGAFTSELRNFRDAWIHSRLSTTEAQLRSMSYEGIARLSRNYHRMFYATSRLEINRPTDYTRASASSRYADSAEGYCHLFDDDESGFSVYRLGTTSAYFTEGEQMQHCISTFSGRDDIKAFSFQYKGKPIHAGLTVTYYVSPETGLNLNKLDTVGTERRVWKLYQALGFRNRSPSTEEANLIKKLHPKVAATFGDYFLPPDENASTRPHREAAFLSVQQALGRLARPGQTRFMDR